MRGLFLAADPWVRSFLAAWILLASLRWLVLIGLEIRATEGWRWFCAGLQLVARLP